MVKKISCIAGIILSAFAVLVIINYMSLTFFIINIRSSPNLKLEFAGINREIKGGDEFIFLPVIVKSDSEINLTCEKSSARDGYITPRLNIIIYAEIDSCKITKYKTYF